MKTQQVVCIDCGAHADYHPSRLACPVCGSTWLEACYDLSTLSSWLLEKLPARPFNLWRYAELLPVPALPPSLQLGEGGTPLLHAGKLGTMLGLPQLYFKDERKNATASFKDRQAAVNVAAFLYYNIDQAVVASTGNVAISYSAYCARTGINLWAFITSLVPAIKMHEIALYGTRMVKVTGTYDQAKTLAAEFARERNLFIDRGPRNIATIESMKTIAFEIAEQLGNFHTPSEGFPFQAPDWYIQAVSGGMGPLGVLKGFQELLAMGWIESLPSIACIQTDGCSPMVQAWKQNAPEAFVVERPSTHISTLTTGNPGRSYALLRERMEAAAGGVMESVSDEEAFRAMVMLARTEGLSVEPAAAVAFAGAIKLAQEGVLKPEDRIVINCSGHTVPIEHRQIPSGWSLDIDLSTPTPTEHPQDGLLAALTMLDERHTREILIVDDHPDARRLIQRILLTQGKYAIREAGSGPEALAEALRNPPDLILLDIMMPEMDGFTVIDHLKENPATASIPIIVITAKSLTAQERRILEGQIARFMLKGDLLDEDLLSEVVRSIQNEDPRNES
ncbi:MAG: pyridoxal-phosphate dependent enzyme [Anaerolineales bacterium]|nr:pyridoxal-phosphate dependent enzyme [Anaerolineales bacterium]